MGIREARRGRGRGRARGFPTGSWVVVNATDYADLDVVALAVARQLGAGRHVGIRCGPSFVPSLIGAPRRAPLTAAEIFRARRQGWGLVVVGSHV
ncbi:MAG: hypothetical protein M3Z83_04560 [Actinomycetota bacterium]|nr:hypothetical protein [Actinomycetota bacterium]